jgi:hypothetical protein
MKILSKLLAVVTFPVLMAGCVFDINRAITGARKPSVVFATPAAWRCNREKSTVATAEGRLEPCTICTNIARTPQAVSINKTEHTVPAQGNVAMCETSAFVSAP